MTGNEDYARIIPFNNDENELVIYQEMLTDVGGVIWDSALMTIHYFFKNPTLFEGKKVNEYYYGQELDRLESLGVLKKVNHSSWAAPLVCVKKKDTGALRICADFKTGLNAALEDEDHPIPTPEDVFATLNGGTVFSTVDLKDAYFQIELAEESKPLLTVNTHRGLYQYQRLPFGAKTAPMVFQRIMDKMITGLSGVTAYLDDVIIVGRDEKEHNENLFELFQRIAEYGFRVKLEKCSVYAKVFERNAWSWKPATVIQRQGRVVYMVRLNDGRERVVHVNQLKLRVEQTDECKDELWTTTMFDIFEVPVPQETSTPMSVTTSTFATPSREQQQQGLSMQQGHQSRAQARMPSSAQFSQRSQQHQSPGVVPVRRGNRVRKPVNRYDPSN
uniref:Reverse transcriptase domain-containing protein n=3 Tax=Caenorhabditis japonica TaxID=281687 RepID=A0A8R1EBF5_CAEJA